MLFIALGDNRAFLVPDETQELIGRKERQKSDTQAAGAADEEREGGSAKEEGLESQEPPLAQTQIGIWCQPDAPEDDNHHRYTDAGDDAEEDISIESEAPVDIGGQHAQLEQKGDR
jgi:hypothetical protein